MTHFYERLQAIRDAGWDVTVTLDAGGCHLTLVDPTGYTNGPPHPPAFFHAHHLADALELAELYLRSR